MPLLAPPLPPLRVAIADDDSTQFWLRHWLLIWPGLTILVTAWFISLGPIPGILALLVAKDILVALLAAGLGLAQESAFKEYSVVPQQQSHRGDQLPRTRHKPGDQKKWMDAYDHAADAVRLLEKPS
jgi:hypothetical protein